MRLKIKEWMALRDVNQAQISTALGVSRAAVSAWVEGRADRDGGRVMVFPDPDSLEALCLFFECTPGDLIELQRDKTATGLVWKAFRHAKRGLGRPPLSARARPDTAEEFEEEPFEDEEPEEEDDVQEIVLFPDLGVPAIAGAPERPVQAPPRSSDELLGTFGNMPLASLREWLGIQLSQVDGQLRNYKPKPGLTPAQLAQAREVQVGRKAMRDAYSKAMGKLEHYVQRD